MTKSAAAAVLAAMLLLDVSASMAQSSDELGAQRREIEALKAGQEALKAGQDAVLKELQEIRALLGQRPAAQAAEPRDIALGIDGAPVKGDQRAKLVLIDFSDYQ